MLRPTLIALSISALFALPDAAQAIPPSDPPPVNDDKRSATSIAGRARFSYQFNPANSLQLVLNAQGKTLFGEGYRQPTRTADLNYRRKLSDALSLVVNVNDVFDSQKSESITETDRLREYSIRRQDGRLVYVGLSYRFGTFGAGRGPRGPGFGPPGGGMGPGPR